MTESIDIARPLLPADLSIGNQLSVVDIDELDVVSTLTPTASRRRRYVLLHGRGLFGLLLVTVVLVLGIFAPLIAPGPLTQLPHANLLPASWSHPFGTDAVDRDVLSRSLYGIRIDVLLIFVAVPVGALVGTLVGVVATLYTWSDVLAQRVFDVLLAFPALVLAIGVTAITGPGITPIIAVIVAIEIPIFGRLVRTGTLRIRELPFVEAAEVIGASRWWVLRRHVLPNAAEALTVQLALSMSTAIFIETAMSFIGIGIRPPHPSLGNILSDSVSTLNTNPATAVGPLILITALVLGFQLIAQALGARRRG